MTELDAVRISAVFAADAQLDSGPSFVALLHGNLDQLADSGLVDRGERILLDYFQLLIGPKERTRIVAAHAEAGLGQVIGPKTQELGRLREFIACDSPTKHLTHRANPLLPLCTLFLPYFPLAATG